MPRPRSMFGTRSDNADGGADPFGLNTGLEGVEEQPIVQPIDPALDGVHGGPAEPPIEYPLGGEQQVQTAPVTSGGEEQHIYGAPTDSHIEEAPPATFIPPPPMPTGSQGLLPGTFSQPGTPGLGKAYRSPNFLRDRFIGSGGVTPEKNNFGPGSPIAQQNTGGEEDLFKRLRR